MVAELLVEEVREPVCIREGREVHILALEEEMAERAPTMAIVMFLLLTQ